jgi:hypothetical protein
MSEEQATPDLVPFDLTTPALLLYPVSDYPATPDTRVSKFRERIHLCPWCWRVARHHDGGIDSCNRHRSHARYKGFEVPA